MRTTLNQIINATFESFNLFSHYCTSNKVIYFQKTFMDHYVTEFKHFTDIQQIFNGQSHREPLARRGSYVEIHNSVSGMSLVQWHLTVQYIACTLTTPGCR